MSIIPEQRLQPEVAAAAIAEEETAQSVWHDRAARLGLIGAKAVLAASLGGTIGLAFEPPAHLRIDGVEVSSQIGYGQDHSDISAPNAGTIHSPKHKRLLLRDIGINISVDAQNIDISDANNNYSSKKLVAFQQRIGNSEPLQASIRSNQITHSAEWAAGGAFIGLGVAAYAMRRRKHLQAANTADPIGYRIYREHTRASRLQLQAAVVAGAGIIAWNSAPMLVMPNQHTAIVANPVFDGTGLEGSSITGVAATLIHEGAEFMQKNDLFFGGGADQLQTIVKQQYNQAVLPKAEGTTRVMFIDDIQGRVGMMQYAGRAANILGANGIWILGDTGITGSELDEPLMQSLRYYAGGHMGIFADLSEHDSPTIAKLMHKYHFQLGNDKIQDFLNMKVLGVNVPLHADLGNGGLVSTGPSLTELTDQILALTSKQHVDVFGTHFSSIADTIAQSGTVASVNGGRNYEMRGPFTIAGNAGVSHEVISGSSGALKSVDGPSIGIITNPAPVYYIDYVKDSAGHSVPVAYGVTTLASNMENNVAKPSASLHANIPIDVSYDNYLKGTEPLSNSSAATHGVVAARRR